MSMIYALGYMLVFDLAAGFSIPIWAAGYLQSVKLRGMTRCGQISRLHAKHIGEMEDDALCWNYTVSKHVLVASGNF